MTPENPPPPVDRRISIKDIAKRCGLEVRKMPSPVIFVRGIKIIARPFRFKDVAGLRDLFRGFRSGGVGRIYLYELQEHTFDVDGKKKKGWVVRIGFDVNVGYKPPPKAHARRMVANKTKKKGNLREGPVSDAVLDDIERRMREYQLGEGKVKMDRITPKLLRIHVDYIHGK